MFIRGSEHLQYSKVHAGIFFEPVLHVDVLAGLQLQLHCRVNKRCISCHPAVGAHSVVLLQAANGGFAPKEW